MSDTLRSPGLEERTDRWSGQGTRWERVWLVGPSAVRGAGLRRGVAGIACSRIAVGAGMVAGFAGAAFGQPIVDLDAATDTPGDAVWDTGGDGSASDRVFTFDGVPPAPDVVSLAEVPAITAAYRFPQSAVVQPSYAWRRDKAANFSILFRPDYLRGSRVVFEVGSEANGVALYLEDDRLVLDATFPGEAPASIEADVELGWVHAVVTVNTYSDRLGLWVNGELAGEVAFGEISNWADTEVGGIGAVRGTTSAAPGASGLGPFDGIVARYRVSLYGVYGEAEVAGEFEELTGVTPVERRADHNRDGSVTTVDVLDLLRDIAEAMELGGGGD